MGWNSCYKLDQDIFCKDNLTKNFFSLKNTHLSPSFIVEYYVCMTTKSSTINFDKWLIYKM